MCRYFLRKEHFGAVLYDTYEYEYLFCDEEVSMALLNHDQRALLAKLPILLLERGSTLFDPDGSSNYEILTAFSDTTQETVLSAPLQVYYDITRACNLRCKHCYISSGNASPSELPLAEISKWARELREHGVFKISVGGGEPLTHPDAYEILRAFRDNDISLSLSTNATLLDGHWIELLNQLDIRTLTLSMEGGTRESYEYIRGKGTWNLFVHNASNLRNRYANRFAIRVTITKQTVNEVQKILQFASEIGAYAVKFKFLQFEGRTLDNRQIIPSPSENLRVVREALKLESSYGVKITVPIMFSIGAIKNAVNRYLPLSTSGQMPFKRDFGCGGGQTGLYIHPDGTYSACVSLGELYDCGNLREVSLCDAWHYGAGVKRMRAIVAPRVCQECFYLEQCRGGCRARAMHLLGNPNEVDPYCPFQRGGKSCVE